MSEPFIAEIRLFGFDFTPRGWAFCSGQLLSIAQNQALFSLVGTTYGGNGTSTFGLPDLRGRTPVHFGTGAGLTVTLGEVGGLEQHILTTTEMPAHTHSAIASSAAANSASPSGNYWAGGALSFAPTSNSSMSPTALSSSGTNQPHDNMQPYLVLNFCIALTGIFPSRN